MTDFTIETELHTLPVGTPFALSRGGEPIYKVAREERDYYVRVEALAHESWDSYSGGMLVWVEPD